MLFRRLVLVGQQLRERAHARAEKRLFLRDEIAGAQIADERARLRRAEEIDRDGCADGDDPDELEEMPQPPAELHIRHQQRRWQGRRERGDPDHDDHVGRAMRQQVGLERAEQQDAEQRGAEDERDPRGRAAGRRDAWDDVRHRQSDQAEEENGDEAERLQGEQRAHGARAAERRRCRQREDRSAGGERGRTGEGDDAVHPDDHAGRRKPVDREQR